MPEAPFRKGAPLGAPFFVLDTVGSAAGPTTSRMAGIPFRVNELESFRIRLTRRSGVCYTAAPFWEDLVYAIIRSGGKQYRVAEGDRLQVERDVLGSAEETKVTFNEVLMVGGDQPKVGSPTVEGASVGATVLGETRGDKIIVFKKKRRKNHTKRTHGHRQNVVEVRIDSINV